MSSPTTTQCEQLADSSSTSSSPSHLRLCSAALEEAEQELYANLHIENPRAQHHQQEQRDRKWSRLSDSGSEHFSTPPTSPGTRRSPPGGSSDRSHVSDSSSKTYSQNGSASPTRTSNRTKSSASWTTNPLYVKTSGSVDAFQPRNSRHGDRPASSRRRATSRDSEPAIVKATEQQELCHESSRRRAFRSNFRSRRAETDPGFHNNSALNSFVTSRNKVNSNVTGRIEENNNVTKSGSTSSGGEVFGAEDTAYIELDGCFPSDAPDHTLLKPSKLRASLRGRRRLTNGSSADSSESAYREACMSPPPAPTRSSSSSSSTRDHPRNVIVIENKSRSRSSIASCSAQEKIPYTSSSSSPAISYSYGTSNNNPEPADQPYLFDKLNANTSDALVKPSRMRESFRRQRNNKKYINNENVSRWLRLPYTYRKEQAGAFPESK